jgi:hypothetical protein
MGYPKTSAQVAALALALAAGLAAGAAAAEPDALSPAGVPGGSGTESPADWEREWDPDWDLQARIAAVNEGGLRLLPPAAAAHVHVHTNRIRIDRSSLRGGWIRLDQCHDRLDPVPAAEVTFNPGRIRGLRVSRSTGIGRAWVEGATVQLEDVGRGAALCIGAESRALRYLGEGRWRLQNGPYLRRFLDGYYPMGVVLEIDYPRDALRLAAVSPPPQPGLEVAATPGRVRIEATFEGRLYTCLDLLAPGAVSPPGPPPPCPLDPVPPDRSPPDRSPPD